MTATPYRLAHIHGDRWRVMKGKRLVVRQLGYGQRIRCGVKEVGQ